MKNSKRPSALHGQEERHECPNCCSSMMTQMRLRTLWELGQGGQGVVFLCTDQAHGARFACKTIRSHAQPHQILPSHILQSQDGGCKRRKLNAVDAVKDVQHLLSSSKRKLSAEEVFEDTQLRWEAEVLQSLKGIPGVLPLVSTFEGDDSCFHLVTAFCDAGDLLSKLDAHPPLFKLSEREAAPIIASLARTLSSCHARGVIHRDIKPGNILFRRLEGKDEDEVVLADFGLAATITPGETLCDRVGTSRYQAPEVIQGQYDHRADIWSLGIVTHLLLTSALPFIEHLHHDASDSAIQHSILCNDLKLDGFDLSSSARDLLSGILCKDPTARLTLEDILCHPWLLHNMSPISNASTQAESNETMASPPDLTVLPSKPEVQRTIRRFEESESSTPKIKRFRGVLMGRNCYRQQWRDVFTKAAIA